MPVNFAVLDLQQIIDNIGIKSSENFTMDCNLLFVITNGEVKHQIDFNTFYYAEKNMFSVLAGQVQKIDVSYNTTGYCILFNDNYINYSFTGFKWIQDLNLFNNFNCCPVTELTDSEFETILSLIEQIKFETIKHPKFDNDEMLSILFKSLLLHAERTKKEKIDQKILSGNDYLLFNKLKNYIDEQFHLERAVNYYAQILFVTPKKVNSLSKKFWGITAKRAIEERTILEIKRLLFYTNYTIKEIGDKLGFKEPTNFNKFFKKITNITPAEFRRNKT
ncbi:MAG: helix-turn-helix domain-containing protein [bacterium]